MYQSDFLTSVGIAIGLFYLVFVIGLIALGILYFKNLVELMAHIRPNSRLASVGDVLWVMVPLVGSIYGFIVYPRICDSIASEYRKLGLEKDGDFGRSLVTVMQVCSLLGIIPIINFLAIPTGFVLWIIFFVKINRYKAVLVERNKYGFSDGEFSSKSEDILD